MISKIVTEHIYEYDANGNIVREIEKTTEEYDHDFIRKDDTLWSTIPPFWWIGGPTCDSGTPYMIESGCSCCGDGECTCCEDECGW